MSKNSTTEINQPLIIEPQKGWQVINWSELIKYKDLIYFLIMRDVKAIYKQTVLGFSWAILRPVFHMIVFSVVFGKLAKIPSDGLPYPIFSYAAIVPWTYFATSMTRSTSSLIGGAGMFTKVYFPRLIIPFTPIVAGLVDFIIAFSLIFALMAWYGITPTVNILFIPFLVILMILTASGMGMWLSALAIQYRDVPYGVQFLSQIMMYAAPVAWPVSLIPESYRFFYGFYPMAGVIEGFRAALLGHNPMPWDLIATGSITAILIFIFGAFFFRRKERIFADVV
ncbi:MAG: ABC transporter permease [Candidatus Neomarinimicrobiota bacterium]